jgi:hypothetical protein
MAARVRRVNAPGPQAGNAGQALQESQVLGISDGPFGAVDRPRLNLQWLLHDSEYTYCSE